MFLSPDEDAYIPLLALHQVPIEAATSLSFDSQPFVDKRPAAKSGDDDVLLTEDRDGVDAAEIRAAMMKACTQDRDVLEKGTKAFISFLRGCDARVKV